MIAQKKSPWALASPIRGFCRALADALLLLGVLCATAVFCLMVVIMVPLMVGLSVLIGRPAGKSGWTSVTPNQERDAVT